MNFGDKVNRIGKEATEIRAIYRTSLLFKLMTELNTVAFLIVGIAFLLLGWPVLTIPSFMLAMLNFFIWINNRPKKDEKYEILVEAP